MTKCHTRIASQADDATNWRRLQVAGGKGPGRRGPRLVAPLWLAKLGLPFIGAFAKLTGAQPLYTGPSLRALSEHRECSNAKARAELDFTPRPLERTIADTFAFYAQAGLLTNGAKRGKTLPAEAFL